MCSSDLRRGSINPIAAQEVDAIVNRAGDGPCPIESAVADIDDPQEALVAVRQKLADLRRGTRTQ